MKVAIIAIAGGSGSGKTWLAGRLKRRLGRSAATLLMDDFYRDLKHLTPARRARMNFDDPHAIDWGLLTQCLVQIKRGQATRLPRYDYSTHTRRPLPRVWHPRPIVILEGLWPLWKRALRRHYALSIYCECPQFLRLNRRIRRDQNQRGRTRASVLRQWRQQVVPLHQRFVAPQAGIADILIGPRLRKTMIASLAAKLREIQSSLDVRSDGAIV